MMILLFLLLLVGVADAHTGPLDDYGCHSDKARFGNSTYRECHADLLAGQTFLSATAEYKAMIAALRAKLAPKTLSVQWNANSEPDLAGYRIYCGTTSKLYTMNVSVANVMTATVPNLTSGTYYCAVTAFDTANNESVFSQEVSKVIP